MIDFALKRDAMARLIAKARSTYAAASGEQRELAATWLEVLVEIDEDLIRAHHKWHELAMHEDDAITAAIAASKGRKVPAGVSI